MSNAPLTLFAIASMLLSAGLMAGCKPANPPALPETRAPSTDNSLVADGGTCMQASDCNSGICEGQGCDDATPGTCVSADRACTADLRQYCSCDGTTFDSSGSCAGRRYSAKDACEVSP